MTHRTVWKYALEYPEQSFQVPVGADLLTVETQHGTPTVWFLVNPTAPREERTFFAFGTGHPIVEQGLTYRGTAHDVEGQGLVFHIFERGRSA